MDNKKAYYQPFNDKQFGSERNRIPALYTLSDGSVIAGADMRYGHGSDSPNNIDIAVALSKDGYADWEYVMVNSFDDYSAELTEKESASFIDSTIVQSETGRIFMLADAYTAGGGYLQSKTGTGYAEIDGKKRMLLTTGNHGDKLKSFGYYIGDYENGIALVLDRKTGEKTEYTVDEEFRLYKNGEAIYCAQKGSEGVSVQQRIFYAAADLKCYKTTYLWLRYSDDNGKSWSAPKIISPMVKSEDEGFLGVGPGRGTVIEHNGKQRILFCIYDNNGGPFKDPVFERASVIYSDDNGETWVDISPESIVSMNLWGFKRSIIEELGASFEKFLAEEMPSNPLKSEFFLPTVVQQLLKADRAEVKVLESKDKWFGVTYKEDKEKVVEAIAALKAQGVYPEYLWRK